MPMFKERFINLLLGDECHKWYESDGLVLTIIRLSQYMHYALYVKLVLRGMPNSFDVWIDGMRPCYFCWREAAFQVYERIVTVDEMICALVCKHHISDATNGFDKHIVEVTEAIGWHK